MNFEFIRKYNKERDEAVASMDVEKFRKFAEKYNPRVQYVNSAAENVIANGLIYREQPTGEWIENTRYKRKGKRFFDCSRCHYGENGDIICETTKIPNFCPNCGARMKGGH